MNIYFKEDVFKLLKEQIPQRKISNFVNNSVMENLLEQKKKQEELQKKKIIAYYQKMSADSSLQEDLSSLGDLALESLKDNVKK